MRNIIRWGGKQRKKRSREIWLPSAYRRTGDTWTMGGGRGRRWKTRGLIEILFKKKFYPKSLEAKGPLPHPRRRVIDGEQGLEGCSHSRERGECCSESECWHLNLCFQPHPQEADTGYTVLTQELSGFSLEEINGPRDNDRVSGGKKRKEKKNPSLWWIIL